MKNFLIHFGLPFIICFFVTIVLGMLINYDSNTLSALALGTGTGTRLSHYLDYFIQSRKNRLTKN